MMFGYALRRLLATIPVLMLVTLLTFLLIKLVPGDPAAVIGGPEATDAQLDVIRHQLGLDQPFLLQMGRWYWHLLHGDLGDSFLLSRGVSQAIVERLPVTLSLAGLSMLMSVVVAVAMGLLAAVRANSWLDQLVMTLALLGVALPNFWLALLLIIVFAVHLNLLPSGGYIPWTEDPWGWLQSCILPAVSLALLQIGLLARITRSTMLEVLNQDYVRTAWAKGLSPGRVIGLHALKNALVPILTVAGIALGLLLGGSVVIETVFAIPGVGKLIGAAILRRDYPIMQGGLLFITALTMLVNLAVDLLYVVIDPRVAYERNRG
jgi:peptide/nickel transport system permease protein